MNITPGMWTVAPRGFAVVVADKWITVAECNGPEGPDSEDEARANANAIAAVPLLIAALGRAADTIRYLDENYDERDSYKNAVAALEAAGVPHV